MAQHDYIIANQSGAAFRSDLNNGLAAIVSQNSGAAQPSTTYAYQWWADTTTGLLKLRNAANNAWITIGTLADANLGHALLASPTFTGTVTIPAGASISGFAPLASPTFTGTPTVPSLNGGPLAGFRNRVINGAMTVNQRGSSSLSSGVSTVTYLLDRWYGFATGAAVNLSYVSNGFRVTGAASNTAANVGQRIEAANSSDLSGSTVTLSFLAASSNSVTLNWKVSYANSADNFGSSTQSNTGTVSTTSSPTRYSATFTLSGAATTGIQIEFFVNNFTSGTFDINAVQLEPGPVATPFERRSIGTELALCQRYYQELTRVGWRGDATNGQVYAAWYNHSSMRGTPSVVIADVSLTGFASGIAVVGNGASWLQAEATCNSTGTNRYWLAIVKLSAEL